ncbi:MAG TPA: hypothetical protein VND23_01300 [Acidimicrobiales bacterium]|nr:hypothetical protein [Acidimicrobiales bacterium]
MGEPWTAGSVRSSDLVPISVVALPAPAAIMARLCARRDGSVERIVPSASSTT